MYSKALFSIIIFLMIPSCTFINKQSFEIDYTNGHSSKEIMLEIEKYFQDIGFKMDRKTQMIYPEEKIVTSYFLGKQTILLYTSFDHVILRLEDSEKLYIDWIRISDYKETPSPGYFDKFYEKVTKELKERLGVTVSFNLIEGEKKP